MCELQINHAKQFAQRCSPLKTVQIELQLAATEKKAYKTRCILLQRGSTREKQVTRVLFKKLR